jgi:serine protease
MVLAMLNPYLKWLFAPVLLLVACNPTTPTTGKLSVQINGLSGTAADVNLSGPGVNQKLTASTTLDLTPGSYTVSANKVNAGAASYTPTVSGSPAQVVAGQTRTIIVSYVLDAPTTGKLKVDINGLSGTGAAASVKVVGPSTNQTLTASAILDVAPGSYTVTASPVTNGTASFNPSVADSPALVQVGQTSTVTVTYVLNTTSTGSISGNVSLANSITEGLAAMDFVPGEAIVRFKSNTSLQSLSLQSGGTTLQKVSSLGSAGTALYRANISKAQTVQMIGELENRADVLYAHPNYIMGAFKTPNDELFSKQWDLPAMKLPEAWDIEDGSSNAVTVAVIDTGILSQHPDFAGKLAAGGYDFVSSTENAADGDGRDPDPEDPGDNPGGQGSYHGSHVAGTVAAATNNTLGIAGVSWGAKIQALRVLGKNGGSVSDIVDAMRYAAGLAVAGVGANPNPAQILNLSLGGPATCAQVKVYQEVINEVVAAGKMVVVAAGNDNIDASKFVPASCSGVITVGATDPNTKRARYSNFGPRIDVMAPGGDSLITLGGNPGGILGPIRNDTSKTFVWEQKNGTSMAAPHVAGLLALMKSKKPSLTPSEALDVLKRTSVALATGACTVTRNSTTTGGDGDCGKGLVNALEALKAVSPPAPTPDFSLSLSPNSLSSTANKTATVTISLARINGFNSGVSLSFSGVAGVGGSFDQNNLSGNTATLTLNIGDLAAGSYALSVQGTGGGITRTANLTLTITAAPSTSTIQGANVFYCRLPTGVLEGICDNQNTIGDALAFDPANPRSSNYSRSSLTVGYYYVFAWKDINGNGNIDKGDYYGDYPVAVVPTQANVNLFLDYYNSVPPAGLKLDTQSIESVR